MTKAATSSATITRQQVVCQTQAYGTQNCTTVTYQVPVATKLPKAGITGLNLFIFAAVALLIAGVIGMKQSLQK